MQSSLFRSAGRSSIGFSLPFLGTGDVRGQFTDDAENAVLINRRNVALYLRYELTLMHPDMDFMIIDMKGYKTND